MFESVKLKTSNRVEYKNAENIENFRSSGPVTADIFMSIIALFIGVAFVYVADQDLSSIVFAVFFAMFGMSTVVLLKGNKYEFRAFILSYSICVLILGFSLNYSLAYFDMLMSTIDSNKFINIIADSNRTLEELRYVVDATLPALIWKYLADFRSMLNIGDGGPAVYVLLNSTLIGFTSVFITKIANELFVGDEKRIKLAGTIFSLCGMGWLFGSLLIRDSYALLLNTLGVWVIVKVLVTPNVKNLILALIVCSLSASFMWYVREKAFYLFFMFAFMAIGLWYLKSKFSPAKVILLLFMMIVAILAFDQISSHTSMATDATSEESEKYTAGSSSQARSDSLGASLVVNQPLPVRLIVGSAYVLIFPIPIWGYFQLGLPEYFIIKGLHGVFMILMMPLVIYSSIKLFKRGPRKDQLSTARFFVFFYFLVTVMLVGVTTLETRHHGQFLSAFIILAAMPTVQTQLERGLLKKIRISWFGLIAFGHVIWFLLRFR